jgi:aspartyl-tRNA(Asn)/glutamyl-tRNA(Gln) amidotransferase subunit B
MANKQDLEYYPTIGIECHVQFRTISKLFSAVDNDAREAAPNTHISHICLGMPGSLPYLNEKAVELACRAAFALGTRPQLRSTFDRKHYFYPDLPKGYQITQFEAPIIIGGSVAIAVDGHQRQIGLERAHLEEDAGKSTHPDVGGYSLVDLNRAGTPLLEIVSKPEIHTPAEARAYARELYLLMRYADVSDADLFHGNMRFDVNVSISSDPNTLGTRTETKNLNSFRSVEKAVAYEIKRQTELLKKGEAIVQQTLGWDDAKQKTVPQRSKEEAHDYRYFPEPDIPPIELSEDYVAAIEETIPLLPDELRTKLASQGVSAETAELLIEAQLDHAPVDYIDILSHGGYDQAQIQYISNMMVQVELPLRQAGESGLPSSDNVIRKRLYEALYEMSKSGQLSSTNAKAMLKSVLLSGAKPKDFPEYAQQQGYSQVSDEATLEKVVDAVIGKNPSAVKDIQAGELKAIGFLVGQVMKETQGKANPGLVKEIISARTHIEQ